VNNGRLQPQIASLPILNHNPVIWERVYQDDAYHLYGRPGLNLRHMDRRREKLTASFPY
jgi:hypothetical protein